jgi:hypothetical protein
MRVESAPVWEVKSEATRRRMELTPMYCKVYPIVWQARLQLAARMSFLVVVDDDDFTKDVDHCRPVLGKRNFAEFLIF